MPYLVDGDNLLGTWRGRDRSDQERRDLTHELSRFARRVGRRVVVVFDGPEAAGTAGGDVHFAGRGRSADDLILGLLSGQSDRRGWIVVTSDRSLGDRCRHLGARIERCDRFRARLRDRAAPEKPGSEEDVDLWLERFGGDPAE